MINISISRGIYILTPTVPSTTVQIDYTVSVSGQLNGSTNISASTVFVGKSRYFGGDYEVDCSDWIDAFITKYNKYNGNYTTVTSVTVSIAFTYTNDDNTTSTQTKTCTWTPDTINLAAPTFDGACGSCQLVLYNSGFVNYGSSSQPLKIKILTFRGRVIGKVTNNLDKTDYMDRYGDKHNGSITNKMEVECYVDPDWYHINNNNMVFYNQLMTAMQCAKKSVLGPPSGSVCSIQGFTFTGGGTTLDGRVKNVEKVDIYSSYNVNQKVPTMKITFEVYR